MHTPALPHHIALARVLACLLAALLWAFGCVDDTASQTDDIDTATNNATNNSTDNAAQPDPPTAWRYVLVEDQTDPVAGEFPGIDIDAIELITADGTSRFATTVEDFNSGGGSARDPSQALGEPDSNCDANSGRFVSLGGRERNGFIIVSFSSNGQDIAFGSGSAITLYELGHKMCGGGDGDPYAVSVSTSTDRSSFVQIGTAVDSATFPVTIDP